jgi:hypothetical protein
VRKRSAVMTGMNSELTVKDFLKPPANAQLEASLVFDDFNGAKYNALMLQACPSNFLREYKGI